MTRVETLNNFGTEILRRDLISTERFAAFNADFTTRVLPENGSFGRIDGLSQIVQKQTGWSSSIADFVESPDTLKIYRDGRLVESNINGKKALVRTDINWRQTDEFGRTNLQRIDDGLSPIAKNGETVELHHMSQKNNAPLAELTSSEHRKIPNQVKESEIDRSKWSTQKTNHWKARAEADITQKQILPNTLKANNELGIKSGVTAAIVTGIISTVNNVAGVHRGEISMREAAVDVSISVGKAAALGYGTGFISAEIATRAVKSSHKAIQTLGKVGLPAAAVSFGIASYNSVKDFAQGEISGTELAHELAENVTGITGAMSGAKAGAAFGALAGPAGAVAGGLVGGMVGYLIAVEAYATIVDTFNHGVDALTDRAIAAVEAAEDLLNTARESGQAVIDFVSANAPEALGNVRATLNDFASTLRVPSISFR